MNRNHLAASAAAFAFGIAIAAFPTFAAAPDYRFELVGTPEHDGSKEIVQIRLVHSADGKPIADAVVFESKADMGPMGMAEMSAPVESLPAKDGIYRFEIDPSGAGGTWALHLAAKIQGEPETVRGTVTADLMAGTEKKPGGR